MLTKTPVQDHIQALRDAGIEVINPVMQRQRLSDEYAKAWLNGFTTGALTVLVIASVVVGIVVARLA